MTGSDERFESYEEEKPEFVTAEESGRRVRVIASAVILIAVAAALLAVGLLLAIRNGRKTSGDVTNLKDRATTTVTGTQGVQGVTGEAGPPGSSSVITVVIPSATTPPATTSPSATSSTSSTSTTRPCTVSISGTCLPIVG